MAVVDWRYMDALQVLDSFVPETPERRRERAQALFLSMNERLTEEERRILKARQENMGLPSLLSAAREATVPCPDPLAELAQPGESSEELDRMTREALRLIGEAKESLGALVRSLVEDEKRSARSETGNGRAPRERRTDDQMRSMINKAVERVAERRDLSLVLGPKDPHAKILGTEPQDGLPARTPAKLKNLKTVRRLKD